MNTIAPESHDRRKYIGGSDIASILGLQPKNWRTALQVWQRKTATDDEPEEESDRQKRRVLARGHVVEPLVARMLEVLHGITGAQKGRRYQDVDFPYFAAEIDLELPFGAVRHLFSAEAGIGIADDEFVNVEIKTVHPFSVSEWGEEGTEDVPIHYAAQIYWGLGVTRRRAAICAALFGADDLVLYPIIADMETISGMRAKADSFWVDNVLRGIPPSPQTLEDAALLWPKDDGSTVEADEAIVGALRTLQLMRKSRKSYEDGEEGVGLLIRETMKKATSIALDGVELATLKAQSKTSIDADMLKESYPDVYRAVARKGTTRVLRLKEQSL